MRTMSHSDLTVVVPFYQRTPEPLVRAVSSIKAQQGVNSPHVLIVDDESPLPARSILNDHFPDHESFIQLIEQKNKGAAGARNTALDHLPESTRYVAFLDSDDEWTPCHLDHALRILSQGYDFYFSNYQRSDWPQDRFS
ncbi:glycosyltransferase family A protein, partial [Ferrovum sp.]|uniref:glycosyltransferase family 2 protein n=1 Tax=Ferrovum sp. TaxID=2609467 RepID=UPI002639B37F